MIVYLTYNDRVPLLNFFKTNSEPFYKSESVRNDQSPKWKLANIDLEPLYAAGCDLDSTLTLVVWDKDRRGKRDLMGQVDTTLTTLLHAKDVECAGGKLIVVRAHRVGHGGTAVSEAATQAMENAANALLSKQSMEKAKQVAAQSQERAVALQKVAEQKVAARTQAAQETVEAQALVGELEAEAKQVAVGAKTQKCTGSLHLTLRCANLRNTDGFFNKSDPFYVLEGADGYVASTCRMH
jgi:Ca2+-dependent lipid-binding protein